MEGRAEPQSEARQSVLRHNCALDSDRDRTQFHSDQHHHLVVSAIINGAVMLPVLVMMMFVAKNPKIMGYFILPRTWTVLGWGSLAIMTAGAAGMFATM